MKIIVTAPFDAKQRTALEARAEGFDVDFVYKKPEELTPEDAKDTTAVLGVVPLSFLDQCPRLEWVQLTTAGADPYAQPGALKEGVRLTNAVGAYGLTVSEHMLAQTFALIRHLPEYHSQQLRHVWAHRGAIISVEGATVAVLGMGNIGGDYARKVKALGAYVIGLRRHAGPKPDFLDEQYTIDRLDEVLPRADIVAMVLPGGPDTEHIMTHERLRRMKKGAYLINAGRGSAIDPDGLRAVLAEGHLGGAALDVTEPEPLPEDDPLWDDPRVLITPHAAGFFFLPETLNRVARIAGENLGRFLRGEPLKNLVR